MSPEEKRMAIATATGALHHRWKKPEGEIAIGGEVDLKCEDCCQFQSEDPSNHCVLAEVPDYLNDLNAMHAAEMTLSKDQHYKFATELVAMTDYDRRDLKSRSSVSAPASLRAEAFLKVIKGRSKS